MTINAQTGVSDVMLGDGSNLVFPFGFKVGSIVEIVAYIDGVVVSPADYTVDLSDDWTGDVVFDEAPAVGAEVVLASDPLFVQSTVHQRQGPFFPDVVEDDLDRATLRDIYLKRETDRAFKLPLLNPVDQAGKFPVVLGDGTQGWSSGTGADAGLRTDLAVDGGSIVNVNGDTLEVAVDALIATDVSLAADLLTALRQAPAQNRGRVLYGSASSFKVFVPAVFRLAGFWSFGNWLKPTGRVFPTGVNGSTSVSLTTDLAVENTITADSWYSIFAVADNGDAQCDFKLMPYFTVKSRASNVVTLGKPGIGADTSVTENYDMAVNALAGCDVLVIEEGAVFSHRTTTVVSNTVNTITLADAGALAAKDRILVSPPGYDNYGWVCDGCVDDAGGGVGEPKNIADTGSYVGSTIANNLVVAATGNVSPAAEIDCRSFISPLATAIVLYTSASFATATEGEYSQSFRHDGSSHEVASTYWGKYTTATSTDAQGGILVSFSLTQSFYYFTEGIGNLASDRQIQPRGYML